MLPCLLFEDEHLLAVNKPPGLNTHAPAPYAGEGLFDWLRTREPRWFNLAILQRLDKETSGVIVFAKTAAASRALAAQFAGRSVRKKYVFITDRPVPQSRLTVVSSLRRAGERYFSRPARTQGDRAETRFQVLGAAGDRTLMEAEPVTGRTHQIRVHAADRGFPILGDTLYGGTPAARLYLHSAELTLKHPITRSELTVRAPADFGQDLRPGLRLALLDPQETNAYRLVHGASDGWPGWYVDRLGEFLLSQSVQRLSELQEAQLRQWARQLNVRGAYHKTLLRGAGQFPPEAASPQWIFGEAAPDSFAVLENGVQFEIRFGEGYSLGLFLDQRENRRRFLTGHIAPGFTWRTPASGLPEVLNAFAYTCGFSVCAAKAGARVTSLDLSKKYLDWGKRNFLRNGANPDDHNFIFGDVFDWFRRLDKKVRRFDVIVLDPPTFSQSKESGAFRVEKNYDRLIRVSLPLLRGRGILFASTNAADYAPEAFLETIRKTIDFSRRQILREHYVPQPPDFPISRPEPAHLKTVWMQVQ
ncbi:MAG: class I SAM-dependent methyltransferase [Verrucomicrobia bacterium]|nr:class I SAM-dependent methyltransferase [Verrucomicrobiota bacterium]